MNNSLVTTGIAPLTIGSVETFQADPYLNGLPWSQASQPGAVVDLIIADPTGNKTTIHATISGGQILATWTVTGPEGAWVRAWKITDSLGRIQYSRPIVFNVESSPI